MKVFRKIRNILFVFLVGILLLACAPIDFKGYLFRYLNIEGRHRTGLIQKTAKDNAVVLGSVRMHTFQAERDDPNNTDEIQEDLGKKNVTDEPLKVYVVEEHHEVLPYWYQAATRGTIPKERNLLVHIDGHIDFAPLLYVPGYPFFKRPVKKQLHYLMQRNDGFIQASAMTGLLEGMIWVWPTWDENNQQSNHEGSYMMYKLYLGWFDVRNESRASTDLQASTDLAFCVCTDDSNMLNCFTLRKNDSDFTNEIEIYVLNQRRCHIMKTLIVEEVSERFAMTYFKKYDWNSNNGGIILDIDEEIQVFCPEDSEQDAETDRFLTGILTEIAKGDNCKDSVLKMSKKCLMSLKEKYINRFTKRLVLLVKNNTVKLCQTNLKVRVIIQTLISLVRRFTSEQIMSLVKVGFCANTSPKTSDVFVTRKFGICIGGNTPNHTAILEHIPTQKEVDSRTTILKGILKRIHHPVGIVTVARSVRDGYTPREYFEQIEKDILASLRDTLDKQLEVVYDKDLLGGEQGWGKKTPNR